jgi:hypothetical protein
MAGARRWCSRRREVAKHPSRAALASSTTLHDELAAVPFSEDEDKKRAEIKIEVELKPLSRNKLANS